MKLDSHYKLRKIAEEFIIVNQGMSNVDMTRVISLNSTAKFLYEFFVGKDFAVEDVSAALVGEYGITKEQADIDAAKWVLSLKDCHIIVE